MRLAIAKGCTHLHQGRRQRGGQLQLCPDPPLKSVPPLHFWPPDCCIHLIQYLKNVAPLLVFGPSFWLSEPPAAKSWRRPCTALCKRTHGAVPTSRWIGNPTNHSSTTVPTLHCNVIGFALGWESHRSLKHDRECPTELLERAFFQPYAIQRIQLPEVG